MWLFSSYSSSEKCVTKSWFFSSSGVCCEVLLSTFFALKIGIRISRASFSDSYSYTFASLPKIGSFSQKSKLSIVRLALKRTFWTLAEVFKLSGWSGVFASCVRGILFLVARSNFLMLSLNYRCSYKASLLQIGGRREKSTHVDSLSAVMSDITRLESTHDSVPPGP